MPRKYSDEDYAAALNARRQGDLPKQAETQGVLIGGVTAEVPLGQFLNTLRSQGRKTALGEGLVEALTWHGLAPRQVSDGRWTIPQTGQKISWRDEDYAAALNARKQGDLPGFRDTQMVVIGGVTAEVPLGQFLNTLRSQGRKTALGEGLAEALTWHGLAPRQISDGRWTIPQTGQKINWRDEHYAAALNARKQGDLPGFRDTQEVVIGDVTADVPLGRFLSTLRTRGRKKALGEGLTEALTWHGLAPRQVSEGLWTVPQTGQLIMWRDEHYAAALNAREQGDLPEKSETQTVVIGGVTADVPLGQFLSNLRSKGRKTALGEGLAEALSRHGLAPRQVSEGLWTVPQTGQRIMWRDEHYTAALNAREQGDLPEKSETQKVVIGDVTADVPIGRFLNKLRSQGRKTALGEGLTEALSRHGLAPRQVSEGLWTIPHTGKKIMWRDEHYTAALNAREQGDLPGFRETQEVVIGGVTADVPLGRFLSALRSQGRKKALGEGLAQALGRHGLSPVWQENKWRIGGATAQAEGARAGRSVNGQVHPRSFTAPVVPPAWDASAVPGRAAGGGGYPGV
ncbi:hypothetical protein, partial [Streptomyces axinellae]|uniref:hypothetical protein n=1 Tax=Streptomyces axinellae TaxID=552788 RepID=UPI0031DCF844